MPPAFKADLQVVHETPAYPRAVELVRDDLPAPVEARLREVLLQAAADPEAGQALHLFFNTSRFLPLDEDSRQALAELRDGVARVRAEVE